MSQMPETKNAARSTEAPGPGPGTRAPRGQKAGSLLHSLLHSPSSVSGRLELYSPSAQMTKGPNSPLLVSVSDLHDRCHDYPSWGWCAPLIQSLRREKWETGQGLKGLTRSLREQGQGMPLVSSPLTLSDVTCCLPDT